MPNMQYMQYMLNMHPPIFCIFVAYLLYEHPADPPKPYPGQAPSGCIFSFFYIYIPNMQFFWGRCIYMGGRCICAIFGIFSWNHGVGCLSA
jgi:hypothetical protein